MSEEQGGSTPTDPPTPQPGRPTPTSRPMPQAPISMAGTKPVSDQTTVLIPAQHSAGGSALPGGLKLANLKLGNFNLGKLPTSLSPTILKRVALGLAVVVVAGAGFVGLRNVANAPADPGAGKSGVPSQSKSPDDAAEGVRRAVEGEAVLQRMADAIKSESRGTFMSTIDPQAKAFDKQARTVYNNLAKLPLATFQLRYVSDDPGALEPDRTNALGGSESWLAQVEVSWQLTGYDAKPARESLPVTFVTARRYDVRRVLQ